jgi:hypothetical protein
MPQPYAQSQAIVQVRAVDALIAVVPYLLGFHPEDSLVVIALSRRDGRVRLAFRFDLRDPPDRAIAAEIVRHAAVLLTRNEFADAVVIAPPGLHSLLSSMPGMPKSGTPCASRNLITAASPVARTLISLNPSSELGPRR